MPSGDDDACYFPRDLGRGSYGGDVHCLQRFLTRKGYLLEEPTGYFGDRTAAATKRWQVRRDRFRGMPFSWVGQQCCFQTQHARTVTHQLRTRTLTSRLWYCNTRRPGCQMALLV